MDGPVGKLVQRQKPPRDAARRISTSWSPRQGYRELVTALYFGDDPNIGSDTVFGVSKSLVVDAATGVPGAPRPDLPGIRYDFRLSRRDGGRNGRARRRRSVADRARRPRRADAAN